jgi:hypothetical protein
MRALVLLALLACSSGTVSPVDAGTDAPVCIGADVGVRCIEQHVTRFHPTIFEAKARGLIP